MSEKRLLGLFNKFSDDTDFRREFKKNERYRKDRRAWLRRQNAIDDKLGKDAVKAFKETRHDRRLKLRVAQREVDNRKKTKKTKLNIPFIILLV